MDGENALGLVLRFKWGEQRLHSALLRPGERGGYCVGTAKGVDFACGDVAGAERFHLVAPGEPNTVRFARGMHGTLWHGDDALTLAQAIERGEAAPDGDGYALTLGRADAVQLEVGGVSVEALPVRVPVRVPSEPLEGLDLRMLNVFGVVFIGAMIAIASAIADEEAGGVSDELSATKSLAHFVVAPPPPKRKRSPASAQGRTAAPGPEGRAPPQKVVAGRPSHAKDVAQQVSQALHGVFSGGPDSQLSNLLGQMKKAGAVSSNGINGLGLRGTGNGGGCDDCTSSGIGAIGTRGRGGGHDPYGSSGTGVIGNKDHPEIPRDPTVDITVIGLDKELIRQVIHRHRSEVRYCYELALTANPQLRGKTAVKFVISPSGAVASATIADSSAHELDDCVSSRVRTWIFPKPPGGGTAIVTYPFVFNRD